MSLLLINIGGSNRKLQNDKSKLVAKFGDEVRFNYGCRGIGLHHSCQSAYIPDNAENKKWVRENKMSVARPDLFS